MPAEPSSRRDAFVAPFEHLRAEGDPRLLIVADHASNAVPAPLGTLGLADASLERHIACDIGIADLARQLSAAMNVPAILCGFSRLVIDANRGEDDPTLVMRLSDGEIIPGNVAADGVEITRRVNLYHGPYHAAVDAALDRAIAAGVRPHLISLHSFTPAWRGRARPWHCAVLSSGDRLTAAWLLARLRAGGDLRVGDNEPYSGDLEGDCMDRHGTRRGLPHALIELRQDLILSPAQRGEWVIRLAAILAERIGGGATRHP